jgi:hypothetical protein
MVAAAECSHTHPTPYSSITLPLTPLALARQVEKHVERTQDASGWRSSLLRVYVLDSTTKGKALGAQQLAWDYDLVLTTISRLSAEWTAAAERGANASLLLQARTQPLRPCLPYTAAVASPFGCWCSVRSSNDKLAASNGRYTQSLDRDVGLSFHCWWSGAGGIWRRGVTRGCARRCTGYA